MVCISHLKSVSLKKQAQLYVALLLLDRSKQYDSHEEKIREILANVKLQFGSHTPFVYFEYHNIIVLNLKGKNTLYLFFLIQNSTSKI